MTGADDLRRSGVAFRTETNLEEATEVFITLEPNGETDISPSGVTIMEGTIGAADDTGIRRADITGTYTNRLGEVRTPVGKVVIMLTQDETFF